MKCPNCNQKMELKREDVSHDFEKKKEYKRAVYFCKYEDIWVTVETPKIKPSNLA